MNHKQVAITALAVVGLLAVGTSAVSFFSSVSFDKRWNDATGDLTKVYAPIPYADLHARALEIMQERADAAKATAASEDRCGAPQDFIGPVLCPPVVAESVPLPRPDPRKTGN